MFRWIARRHVTVHHARGDWVLPKGTIVLRDTDSPMQDQVRFIVEVTGKEVYMDSDYFTRNFERI